MLLQGEVKLTQFSHGAGCGCKIAPNVLEDILKSSITGPDHKNLLVGNDARDDAAVYDLTDGRALIATTDFFMPIVDDAFDFGRIAAANAISDVYAMGGKPILAIAILGWPVNWLTAETASRVIEGGRHVCMQAGIPLAGGHSIDSPEPIFGLAVNGLIDVQNIKQNNGARHGDLLWLTKPLGVGIVTTALKQGLAPDDLKETAVRQMTQLNLVGEALGQLSGVHAMTDVTGFGLLGHLLELCDASGLGAQIDFKKIPVISDQIYDLMHKGAVPAATGRNLQTYSHRVRIGDYTESKAMLDVLADPQTSGGLLVSAAPEARDKVVKVLRDFGLEAFTEPIGMMEKGELGCWVVSELAC